MNPAELTVQIRAIQDRARRADEARTAASGPGLDHGAYEVLGAAAEELRAVEQTLRQQDESLRAARWALDEERRRYHDLFEHAPDAYLVTDVRGVVREANQRAGELFNIRPKFLIGKPLVIFVAEEARPAFRSEQSRLGTKSGVGRYEFRMKPRREPEFDAEVSVVAVPADGGRSIALRWAVRDVTERRQIEGRLRLLNRELERSFRARTAQLGEEYRERERLLIGAHAAAELAAPQFLDLIDGLDAIIWAAEAESGRFTFVSRGAEVILGYPASAWVEDPRFWAEHLHGDDRNWVLEHRKQQLREGRDFESEYRLLARDGRAVWFREAVRVVRDAEGRPHELRGLLVNISRRKKVERQLYAHRNELTEQLEDLTYLRTMSERLSATLELQPILEEILDGAMSVQGALKGVLRLHDREKDELVVAASTGLPEPCLDHIARRPVNVGACGVAFATGRPVVVADVRGEGVDDFDRAAARLGGYRSSLSIPLRDRAGDLLGTIATYFDEPHRPPARHIRLVELFAAQAADFIENASLYRAAREAARGREVFLTILAHELRNPLEAIQVALGLLEVPDRGGAGRAEARAIIERQAGRLDRLIGDLLDSSRIAEGDLVLHREPTDLRQALRRAIESTRADLEGRGQQLQAAIPEVPLRAEADPARMEQVFVNLLSNAARYTPQGGRSELSASQEGDRIVVRVRDDGTGIAPDRLACIFDMVARRHPPAPTPGEGLGVGLWLVRSLVKLHGGQVSATSAGVGQGSEFVVTLPALPESPEGTAAPRSEPATRSAAASANGVGPLATRS